MNWAAASSAGHRGANQDGWRVVDDCLFLIADGMGGLGAGDRAARVALDVVASRPDAPEVTDWTSALRAADDAVTLVAAEEHVADAGTTIAALAAFEGHALISHLGDSRIHRVRSGRLTTLTRDHSISGDLQIDPATIRRLAPWRLDALTAFLGAGPDRLRDTARSVVARPGDRFVLTTDGVHAALDPGHLARLAATGTADDAAHQLVEAAGAAGSLDDRTALVIDLDEVERTGRGEGP